MKRAFDSLISQPLAAEEETWATLPGDLVRLLVSTEPSLLPSLFVLSKHFHLSLALAHSMSDFWRDYFYSSAGLSNFVADIAQGTTWKGLVRVKSCLPRTYYAKVARARFACGLRSCYFGWPCGQMNCELQDYEHRAIDWVERKVELRHNPVESGGEVHPSQYMGDYFDVVKGFGRSQKFIYNETTQSIERWRRNPYDADYVFVEYAAVPPSKLDPKDAWKLDKFYGFV